MNSILASIDAWLSTFVDIAWGAPLIALLIGSGLIFTLSSRLLPFFGFKHALKILRGDYDNPDDPGDISHFQALSTALSSTIGMGNIGGVAIAITQGGPGAVFWMWLAALLGMATKFFTCTLAVMYRGEDSEGHLEGGPMYFIREGLGKNFQVMAILFSIFGMIGCLAMFQTNQIAEAFGEVFGANDVLQANVSRGVGGICTILAIAVILGGVQRIATVASRLVPSMCVLYLACALLILVKNFELVPEVFAGIIHDAFNGTAAVGGAEGIAFATVIRTGVKRAAFSNEAGIGTAPMAHGAAKTTEPVREGLVAMIGPFIDTICICSLTAFIILAGTDWQGRGEITGTGLTLEAFEAGLGPMGKYLLLLIIAMFGLSTIFGYAYYGRKCFSFVFGAKYARIYEVFYVIMLYVGAVWSADMVINMLDSAFALMAWPNLLAALILAPKVIAATRDYFRRMEASD